MTEEVTLEKIRAYYFQYENEEQITHLIASGYDAEKVFDEIGTQEKYDMLNEERGRLILEGGNLSHQKAERLQTLQYLCLIYLEIAEPIRVPSHVEILRAVMGNVSGITHNGRN